jgi:hypothetical protein
MILAKLEFAHGGRARCVPTAEATDWLRSNRLMISPLGILEGFSFRCIVLVKLPSEAVGSEREASRVAAHLSLFFGR